MSECMSQECQAECQNRLNICQIDPDRMLDNIPSTKIMGRYIVSNFMLFNVQSRSFACYSPPGQHMPRPRIGHGTYDAFCTFQAQMPLEECFTRTLAEVDPLHALYNTYLANQCLREQN